MKIFLLIMAFFFSYLPSYAQNDREELITQLKKIELPGTWTIECDSNKVVFIFTDTMALCQYDISPVRYFDDTSTLSTYQLELTLESGWTEKRYKKVKKKNGKLLKIIKQRIISYGDNLNWKVGKTNKQWVELNPMSYLYVVENWTDTEKQMIAQVTRLPNDIIGNTGVFVSLNTLCVIPERKDQLILELYSKLNSMGIHTNFNWRNERY